MLKLSIGYSAAAVFLFCCINICNSLPVTYDQRQDGELNVRADLQNVVIVAVVPKIDVASNLLEYVLTKSGISAQQRRRGIPKHHRIKATKPVADNDLRDPETEIQDRSDVRMPEAFVEPKTPYKVDISEAKKLYQRFHKNDQKTRYSGLGKSSLHQRKFEKKEVEEDTPVPSILPVENNRYVQTASTESGENITKGVGSSAESPKDMESTKIVDISEKNKNEATTDGDEKAVEDTSLKLIGATEQCAFDQIRDKEGICRLIKEEAEILAEKKT